MQGAVCGEREPAGTTTEANYVGQLWALLEDAQAAHDLALQPCVSIQELVSDAASRASLLELGPGVFAGEGWLEQLERLEQHRYVINWAIAALKFLKNPTRKTLRMVLDESFLSEAEKRAALEDLDKHLQAREARLSVPLIGHVIATTLGHNRENVPKVLAALVYEQGRLGMSEIGQRLGQNRSDVYQAVKWFRSLPEAMRAAIKRACREALSQFAAKKTLRPEEVSLHFAE